MTRKICSKCKVEKNLDMFCKSKNGKYGHHHYCKDCLSENKKISYDYDKGRDRRLRSKWSIASQDLNNMFEKQEKKCKICGSVKESVSTKGGLIIDHDHVSGKFRGLICSKCNNLLGACSDSVDVLVSAIEYLEESRG
jgi:hypothetical protein